MKIGIDCRMYGPGFTGISRYIAELIKLVPEMDAQNEYVLFFNDPEYDEFQPRLGGAERIKKVRVNAKHYSFAEQTKFLRILNREKLDLMHFTHFNAPILYRRPFVVTIHDLTLSFFPGKKKTSFLYRAGYHLTLFFAVKKARHIIAVSEHTKQDLQKLLHVPPEKISIVYEGVDKEFRPRTTEEVAEVFQKYRIHRPYLFYSGVWRSHKNVPRLIQAFALLKKNFQIPYQLVITGREDPFYPEVKKTAISSNASEDIIFTGLVPDSDLKLLYAGARAYAFPSLYEGFGLPPLEAMKCRVPVAASGTSCIPEICGDANALFFDPYDVTDMAQKLLRICTDETLRAELIERGAAHAQKFSWEKLARETLQVYQKVLI